MKELAPSNNAMKQTSAQRKRACGALLSDALAAYCKRYAATVAGHTVDVYRYSIALHHTPTSEGSMRSSMRAAVVALVGASLAASIGTGTLRAQAPVQQLEDVVYLKDGSVIRGIIVEQRPGESVLVRTRDGNHFRYRMDQIERLAKEAAPRPTVVVAPKSVGAAIVLSLLLTGAGQGYNGQWGKAGGFFLGAIVSYAAMLSALNTDECVFNDECGPAGGWALVLLGNYMWSVVDAGVSASKINAQAQRTAVLFVRPSTNVGFSASGGDSRALRTSAVPAPGLQLGMRIRF